MVHFLNTWNPLCLPGTSMWLRYCLALNPLTCHHDAMGFIMSRVGDENPPKQDFTWWAKLEHNRPEWKSAIFHNLMVWKLQWMQEQQVLLHLNSLIPAGCTKLPLDLHIKCFLVCLRERPALTWAAGCNQRPRSAWSPHIKTLNHSLKTIKFHPAGDI